MARSQKARTEQAPAASDMFLQRALVTLVLGPLAVLFIFLGGLYYFIPLFLVVGLATVEYATMMAHLGWRLPVAIILPAVLAQLVAAQWPEIQLGAPVMAISLVAAALYALWAYEKRGAASGQRGTAAAEWAALIAGILMLGWMGGHFFLLRGLEEAGAAWTILVMVGTWVADSAAYIFGTRLGRHKLAPRLSPGKTIEGYVSGIVVGTLLTVGLAQLLSLPLWLALVIGLLVSVVSPAGDLAISLLKREAGLKDSGRMLPGHGGAFDRIDSLLWSVTISYYVISLLG